MIQQMIQQIRTRNWVEINDESRRTYNETNQVEFKTSMIRSNLCDYRHVYIHVKATITVTNTTASGTAANNRNKGVTFKNCALFINCRSRINKTQVDDAYDIDIVISMYNLLEYTNIYSKTSESLWSYHRDEPALNNSKVIIDFSANDNNNNNLFNL